ncbi:coiled-coil domain-containing protein 172 isoform X4 [Megalobrama amblycephala]|uniref:coiled-coil domain-containing protein 172 isoform X4 n=1 Tax=Megalobrama amblycephala TaxID=75352 RepID=UPI002013C412|nr:coiled-coil domain-containing protein 172 isoform X4 [Megalobrama amblycephala]
MVKMSLESLFEQILLTEQQVSENIKQLHEVKAAIKSVQDKINSSCEKLEKAHRELDEKAQLLSENKLQLVLMTKRRDQLERQREELLELQRDLKETLDRLKREYCEEREKFLKEMITFNNKFSLISNRNAVFHTQTRSKIQSLELEAETLHKDSRKSWSYIKKKSLSFCERPSALRFTPCDWSCLCGRLCDLGKFEHLLGAAYRELKMSESFSLHLDKPLLKIVPGITSKQKKPTYRLKETAKVKALRV